MMIVMMMVMMVMLYKHSILIITRVAMCMHFRVQERIDIQDVGHFTAQIVDKSDASMDENWCQKSRLNRSRGVSGASKIDPKSIPGASLG